MLLETSALDTILGLVLMIVIVFFGDIMDSFFPHKAVGKNGRELSNQPESFFKKLPFVIRFILEVLGLIVGLIKSILELAGMIFQGIFGGLGAAGKSVKAVGMAGSKVCQNIAEKMKEDPDLTRKIYDCAQKIRNGDQTGRAELKDLERMHGAWRVNQILKQVLAWIN